MNHQANFENQIARLHFHKEENYLEIVYKDLYLDDLEALQALFNYAAIIQEGKKYPSLINAANTKGASKEFRELAESQSPKVVSGLAIVIGNPLARIAGNLFIKFAKLSYPSKLFNNKEKALKWLQEQT